MKKFIIAVVLVAAIVVAAIVYLHVSVPAKPTGVRVPLAAPQMELLAMVPGSADMFAVIPSAAAVYGNLLANPVTADPVERWADQHRVPQTWLIGGADVVVWTTANGMSYAIRLDPMRALLARVGLMFGGADARWMGNNTVLFNAGEASSPIPAEEMSRLMALASSLPAGDALVVQRESDRSGFPPMPRPSVTSLRIASDVIEMTTRAPADPNAVARPLNVRFSHSAILAASFAAPPRVFDDMNRLLLTRVSPLVSDGGAVAIYDVDTGTLLPRPKGVIALPPTDDRREAVKRLVHDSEGIVQTVEQNGEILVSFDSSSLPRYTGDTFDQPRWNANLWSVRLDPQRLVPILKRAGGSAGLRLAAGRMYRATRQLGTWIGPLEQARAIEAACSSAAGLEEMHVLVTAR